jgi:hypothetical protein
MRRVFFVLQKNKALATCKSYHFHIQLWAFPRSSSPVGAILRRALAFAAKIQVTLTLSERP